MLIVHHLKNLIAIGVRQNNRGRLLKIENSEGIEGVEVGGEEIERSAGSIAACW